VGLSTVRQQFVDIFVDIFSRVTNNVETTSKPVRDDFVGYVVDTSCADVWRPVAAWRSFRPALFRIALRCDLCGPAAAGATPGPPRAAGEAA
jgi:hypothetical protein